MSRADLERLSADLESDMGLSEGFACLGNDVAAWVSRAQAKGYHLTNEEAAGLASSFDELSDDELDHVAGGWSGDEGGGG